jgi:hypothetical protein
MKAHPVDPDRIRAAWEGRISGCQLGRPVVRARRDAALSHRGEGVYGATFGC